MILLRTAGWRAGTPPHDLCDLEVCEKLMGTLQRAVPYSDRRLAQSVEGGALLLVLHGGGETPVVLYRALIKIEGSEPTVAVEMIDLVRQVSKVAVLEHHSDDSGRPVLTTTWRFEFEGADAQDIRDEQTTPSRGRMGQPYRFGRAVAEAAGWASPPADADPPS